MIKDSNRFNCGAVQFDKRKVSSAVSRFKMDSNGLYPPRSTSIVGLPSLQQSAGRSAVGGQLAESSERAGTDGAEDSQQGSERLENVFDETRTEREIVSVECDTDAFSVHVRKTNLHGT
jgi:hypothetical protein